MSLLNQNENAWKQKYSQSPQKMLNRRAHPNSAKPASCRKAIRQLDMPQKTE